MARNKKNKKRRRRIIWLVILLIIAALVIAGIINSQREVIPKVTSEQVERHSINEVVTGSGKIFPETEVKISSDVSGEIINLYVEEGDSVQMGQILAKIDPDAYISAVQRGEASVNNAKAQLAIAKSQLAASQAQKEQIIAQLENAEAIYKRNKDLLAGGVISQAEYDQAESNYKALQANLRAADSNIESSRESSKGSEFSIKSAQASLNELRTSLRRTTIKSPVNGVVSLLNVEEGERVVGTIQMAGTEMMRIANLNAMEVQVEISENNILKVSKGDSVDIEVDAYLDRKFKGTVTEIANTASNSATAVSQAALLSSTQVTNFIVKIRIDPKSYEDILSSSNLYAFRPGMSATVDIYTDRVEDVVTVPIQAVTAREREETEGIDEVDEVVFVVQADTVHMVKVLTGIQDDTNIYIKEGLTEGQEVVTGPYSILSRDLKSGDKIDISEKDKKDNKG